MTNIDREHLENYRDFDDLKQAFVDFANEVPFYGSIVACADDAPVASILPRLSRRVVTYGLSSPDAELTASDVVIEPFGVTARVGRRRPAGERAPAALGPLRLRVPGRHNLRNALAAVAVASELGVPFDRIAAALEAFRGAERRFEIRGEPRGILVVDDYGHHPTEIAAVLEAARPLKRRIVVAFQPHRFSRTSALMEAFGPALASADHVVLTDIYPAGEPPIPGVTIEALASSIRRHVRAVDVVPALDDVVPAVLGIARPGDLVITMGAGSIGSLAERLVAALERQA